MLSFCIFGTFLIVIRLDSREMTGKKKPWLEEKIWYLHTMTNLKSSAVCQPHFLHLPSCFPSVWVVSYDWIQETREQRLITNFLLTAERLEVVTDGLMKDRNHVRDVFTLNRPGDNSGPPRGSANLFFPSEMHFKKRMLFDFCYDNIKTEIQAVLHFHGQRVMSEISKKLIWFSVFKITRKELQM